MELVEKKIQSLPPELQQEIIDFIDFVTIRYSKSQKSKSPKKNLATEVLPITSVEFQERVQKSEKDIKNKKILTLKDARKKVKAWK